MGGQSATPSERNVVAGYPMGDMNFLTMEKNSFSSLLRKEREKTGSFFGVTIKNYRQKIALVFRLQMFQRVTLIPLLKK
jgi:hypothetical protein